MDVTNMPAEPLVFQSGTKSAGLELVDIYLWIFKRFMEGKELTRPLTRLVYTNRNTGRTDSVSLQSVAKRSKEFLDKLQEPTAEMMKRRGNTGIRRRQGGWNIGCKSCRHPDPAG